VHFGNPLRGKIALKGVLELLTLIAAGAAWPFAAAQMINGTSSAR
jgi:hypothetical protein